MKFKPLNPAPILEERIYQGLSRDNLDKLYGLLKIEKGPPGKLLARSSLPLAFGLAGLAGCGYLARQGSDPGWLWLLPLAVSAWGAAIVYFAWRGLRRVRFLNLSLKQLLTLALAEKDRASDFPSFQSAFLGAYDPEKVKARLREHGLQVEQA